MPNQTLRNNEMRNYQNLIDMSDSSDPLSSYNPYAGLYMNPTFLDSIGLTRDSEIQNNEYQAKYDEWNANLALMREQREYESPAAIAQRMRAAGLNPDLLGISSSASPSMSTPTSPQNVHNASGNALTFLQNMQNVLSVGFQITQGLQAMESVSLDIENKELDNFSKMLDTATKGYLFENPDDKDRKYTIFPMFSSETSKEKFKNAEAAVFDSPFFRNKYYELMKDTYQNRNSFLDAKFGLGSNGSEVSYGLFTKGLQDSFRKLQLNQNSAETRNISNYLATSKPMTDTINELSKRSKEGDLTATGLLLAYNLFQGTNFSFGKDKYGKNWNIKF